MRVIDLFCGCGGISQGFDMAGFDVIYGLDNNQDSINSFQRNFPSAKVDCKKIEDLGELDIPEGDIIVGGPPCVNFSSSKGSRANVLEGLKLVQAFLKFVWERKPKYWIMENVPRIGLHLPENIPLRWIGIDQEGFLDVPCKNLFNVSRYGAPQKRERLLIGNYPIPTEKAIQIRTLGDVISAFPNPLKKISGLTIIDPIYNIEIDSESLTDHYYDTVLDQIEARAIRIVKEEHPFMGRKAFIDDLNKPARTIVSLQMGRETMIISAGINQYRRATVRECASIQTFPITFQFAGKTIASRYKQAGNAVPPILTFQIAQEILKKEHIPVLDVPKFRTVASFPVAELSTKRKQRKIDYTRPRTINFPGKELRGFRIELKSKYVNNTVGWETIFHQGEGKLNHTFFQTTLQEAIDFSKDNISHLGIKERTNFDKLIKLVETERIEQGDIIHTEMHNNYGATPSSIDRISILLEEYFPKNKYGHMDVGIIEPLVGLSKSSLRIRLVIAIALAKILEEKLNNG